MRQAEEAGFGGFGFGGGRSGGPGGGWQTINIEDLSGFGQGGGIFSDLFASMFGQSGASRGATASRPVRGRDRFIDLRVSFEVAARGGQIVITVPLGGTCPRCGGNGAEPGTEVETCGQCGGGGRVSILQGGFTVQRPCPQCYGRGALVRTPCVECRGSGTVREPSRIKVKIPAGTEEGERIRLRGKGEAGVSGGPQGDLFLKVRIKSDRFFRREGLDIIATVPISVVKAMLGAKIRVRTIHGKKVEINVPAGTQSGTRFRLKGLGVRKGGQTGDQFVEVTVHVPDDLSEEERALVEEMAEQPGFRRGSEEERDE
jgi:molecular chaperone DnaJ